MRRLLGAVCMVFAQRVLLPLAQRSFRKQAKEAPSVGLYRRPGGYVEPDPTINLAVMLAAVDDQIGQAETEQNQAILNACLECMRHERTGQTFARMFGQLIAMGYPSEEAMCRVCANAVRLGMLLEHRLGGL